MHKETMTGAPACSSTIKACFLYFWLSVWTPEALDFNISVPEAAPLMRQVSKNLGEFLGK